MCGICGKLDFNGSPVDEDFLRRMTGLLAHRGPDDSGVYVSRPSDVGCGLGHRRLSIIDLSEAGRQPMCNEDKTVWMVFNGEIYNFGGDLRVCHPGRLLDWRRHRKERDSAQGAVLGKKGRPSAVLTDDFLEGSTGGMEDGRKKGKGFHWIGTLVLSSSYFRLTPVGSD